MNELANAGGIAGLSALLILIGRVIKGVPRFPDEWIPTTLAAAGAVLMCYTDGPSVANLTEGIAAGLAAVGANQMYRQHTTGKPNETKPPAPTAPPVGH